MINTYNKRIKAGLYQIYFWISSHRPIGSIDWSIRRTLGVLFNQAASAADMRMIHSLSATQSADHPQPDKTVEVPVSELPDVDIVVLREQCPLLESLFQALSAQHYPLHRITLTILLAATDTVSVSAHPGLSDDFRSIRYLPISSDKIQSAYEKAMEYTSSPYIFFISCPRIPSSACLQMVVRTCLASPPDVAVWEVGPTLTERQEYCDPITLDIPSTAMSFAVIRREPCNEAGGFDQSFPLTGQGLEMSYRLRGLGYRLRSIGLAAHFDPIQLELPVLEIDKAATTLALMRHKYGGLPGKIYSLLFNDLSIAKDNENPLKAARLVSLREKTQAAPRAKNTCKPSRLWQRPYEIRLDSNPVTIQSTPTKQPLISIIIRTYAGRGPWLRHSICSALKQTYLNLEVIVVEDGSREHENQVNAFNLSLNPPRAIKYLTQEKLGKSHAGNLGLAEARGEYCGFLDDDDLLFPAHIELLYNELTAHAQAVGAYALAWEAHTEVHADQSFSVVHLEVAKHTQTSFDRDKLQRFNFLPIQSVLFSRELFEKYGAFAPERQHLEDWELWQRYTQESDFVYLPRITSLYRTPADPYERVARIRKIERRQVH